MGTCVYHNDLKMYRTYKYINNDTPISTVCLFCWLRLSIIPPCAIFQISIVKDWENGKSYFFDDVEECGIHSSGAKISKVPIIFYIKDTYCSSPTVFCSNILFLTH